MAQKPKIPWPSIGALWSLFWRATVIAPFAMIAGGVWLLTWILLLVLPICEGFYLFSHNWFWASVLPPVWLGLFLLARSKWFKINRTDFPNDQENI